MKKHKLESYSMNFNKNPAKNNSKVLNRKSVFTLPDIDKKEKAVYEFLN